MGKSVFLLPPWKKVAQRQAPDALLELLGPDRLKLEGPLSCGGKAFEGIVVNALATAKSASRDDRIDAALIAVMPQDKLPEGHPRSTLEVPFISAIPPNHAWEECYPETAEGTANAVTADFEGRPARSVGWVQLTALAVSLLRTLDVECYFSLCTCVPCPSMIIPGQGTGVPPNPITVPVILVPGTSPLGMASVIPDDKRFFKSCPPILFEVLDAKAILSTIKLNNAFKHDKALMVSVAKSQAGSYYDCMRKAVPTSHMLYEGMSLWTLSDAQADAARARELFGLEGLNGLTSMREAAEKEIVRPMTDPALHALEAASTMLCDELKPRLPDASRINGLAFNIIDFLGVDAQLHSCFARLSEYLEVMDAMSNHMHLGSDCITVKTSVNKN